MAEKKSISQAVEEELDKHMFVKDAMKIDAVNYSGLARYLIPMLKRRLDRKYIKEGAVIMAIKRYANKVEKSELHFLKVLEMISRFDLMLKGDMVSVTIHPTKESYIVISKLYSELNWARGERIYVSQAAGEISMFLDTKLSKKLTDAIGKKSITHIEKDLAAIIVTTPPEMLDTPGVIHYATGLLAERGIPLIDFFSTYTGMVFVLKEKDSAMAYKILNDRIKEVRV